MALDNAEYVRRVHEHDVARDGGGLQLFGGSPSAFARALRCVGREWSCHANKRVGEAHVSAALLMLPRERPAGWDANACYVMSAGLAGLAGGDQRLFERGCAASAAEQQWRDLGLWRGTAGREHPLVPALALVQPMRDLLLAVHTAMATAADCRSYKSAVVEAVARMEAGSAFTAATEGLLGGAGVAPKMNAVKFCAERRTVQVLLHELVAYAVNHRAAELRHNCKLHQAEKEKGTFRTSLRASERKAGGAVAKRKACSSTPPMRQAAVRLRSALHWRLCATGHNR